MHTSLNVWVIWLTTSALSLNSNLYLSSGELFWFPYTTMVEFNVIRDEYMYQLFINLTNGREKWD